MFFATPPGALRARGRPSAGGPKSGGGRVEEVKLRAAHFLAVAAFAALVSVGAAASSFDEGERLFRENKPAEAVPVFEKAILEPGVDERAWLYLALSYQQLGRLDDASSTLRKGLAQATRFKALYYFDLGNIFILQGKNSFAADMLTQAIGLDGAYAPSYLNRANARLAVKDYGGAKEDYKRYLDLEPGNAQRASIEELIRRLEAGIADTERAAAAAEAKKQADDAARKDLLDKMAASLKAAADETTSLSAGAGDVQGYGDELKLDE
jgi:tetratricopeptide (TPR) repeat protein